MPEEDRPLEELFLDQMIEGYRDGRDPDSPEPSENRPASYRHGFLNGRDDHAGSPRATAQMLRLMADKAITDDIASTTASGTVRLSGLWQRPASELSRASRRTVSRETWSIRYSARPK
jgi:hypothetical protein